MEKQPKLNNSKEVIVYLAKEFPSCFLAEGEAKPLKIGIFQDIVERLGEASCVSKTQLRTALRLYTTSWRYLYGIKAGAQRVDLDGNPCGFLDEQHIEYARKQLEEAKARIQAQKSDQKNTRNVNNVSKKWYKTAEQKKIAKKPIAADAKKSEQSKNNERKNFKKPPVNSKSISKIEIASLKVGQYVRVKAGQKAMDATILEIVKDGARVQLASGMAMLVRAEHIQL